MRGVGGGGRTGVGARAGEGAPPGFWAPPLHAWRPNRFRRPEATSGGPWADSGPDSCFIGPENVLRIFKDEVITHKNPDFSLCLSNPKVLAAPGLHIPGTRLGAEFQRLPLGVWVGDPLSNSRPSRYGWGD